MEAVQLDLVFAVSCLIFGHIVRQKNVFTGKCIYGPWVNHFKIRGHMGLIQLKKGSPYPASSLVENEPCEN